MGTKLACYVEDGCLYLSEEAQADLHLGHSKAFEPHPESATRDLLRYNIVVSLREQSELDETVCELTALSRDPHEG